MKYFAFIFIYKIVFYNIIKFEKLKKNTLKQFMQFSFIIDINSFSIDRIGGTDSYIRRLTDVLKKIIIQSK